MGKFIMALLALVMLSAPAWADLPTGLEWKTWELDKGGNYINQAVSTLAKKIGTKAGGPVVLAWDIASSVNDSVIHYQQTGVSALQEKYPDMYKPVTYDGIRDWVAGLFGADSADDPLPGSSGTPSNDLDYNEAHSLNFYDTPQENMPSSIFSGGKKWTKTQSVRTSCTSAPENTCYWGGCSVYSSSSSTGCNSPYATYLRTDYTNFVSAVGDPSDDPDYVTPSYPTFASENPDAFEGDSFLDNISTAVSDKDFYFTSDNVQAPSADAEVIPIKVSSVSDVDGDSIAEVITDSGEIIDVPADLSSFFESELSVPTVMPGAVSDIQIKTDSGSTIAVSTSDGDILKAAGVPAGATVTSVNSSTGRVDYIDPSDNKAKQLYLSQTQLNQVHENVKVFSQSSTESSTEPFSEQGIDYDAPVLDESIPVFDPTVEVPEKKAIPMHDWIQSIPFAGLLASTSLDVGSGSSVIETDLTLLGQTGHVSFDFSDYSSLFSVMGNIIFAIASFLALRMALIKK